MEMMLGGVIIRVECPLDTGQDLPIDHTPEVHIGKYICVEILLSAV